MKFLQILFWVIILVLIIIFSVNNWTPITISIWGGVLVDTKLPVLIVGSFLIGFLPLYILHRIMKWRLNRKIINAGNAPRNKPLSVNDMKQGKPLGNNVAGKKPANTLDLNNNLESE